MPEGGFPLKKAGRVYVLILFAAILLVPLCTVRWTGAETEATEYRVLADYPRLTGEAEHFFSGQLADETSDWVNDHIGGRTFAREIYSDLYHRTLEISMEEQVVIGSDGWRYLTKNRNLDIARGEFPLTEERLEEIIPKQADITAAYKEAGKKYYLLLTPSKVTVYPEHLPFSAEGLISPAKQMENAMKDAGLKNVINTTDRIQEAAAGGELLFFKTDSHWNARGTYEAYRTILGTLKKKEKAITVKEYGQEATLGDLNRMLGLTRETDLEEAPIPVYQWHSELMEPDGLLQLVVQEASVWEENGYYEPVIYYNESRQGKGTLLIYGDSMMAENYCLARYLAEHYEKVVVVRLSDLVPDIDFLTGATDILFQSTERLILSKLRDVTVPDLTEYADLF